MPKKNSTKNDFPLQAPRGMEDILPQEQKYWEYVIETAKLVFRGWDFQRLDTPILEETNLFTRGVGEDTDIVSKELFELKAKGSGAKYSLRPEGTAATVRSYIEHGMKSWPKPVKLFYVGPFFRYDRPQKGRLRQHHQIGAEVFGSASAMSEVELLYMSYTFLAQLGIEQYRISINSLGSKGDRKAYIKLLKEHYRRHNSKLCRDCKQRLKTNPLRVLDCKEEKCEQVAAGAPRLLDSLSDEARRHFDGILSSLDELEVSYEVTPSLVRGLDYYTGTVWEFVPNTLGREAGQQASIGAGGRYDDLVKELGGKQTAAVGTTFGVERVINQIKDEGIELTITDGPQVFVAQLGDKAKMESMKLMRELQEAQIRFSESIDRDGMQQQLKAAARVGVTWVIVMGQKEVMDGTVILRNMESGMQEVVDRDDLVNELYKRLGMAEG